MSIGKRKMYNEEQKISFIRQLTQSVSTAEFCELVFKAFAPFEEEWGADLCTRSAAELGPAVEKICGARLNSKYRRIVVLRAYVSWCIATGVPGAVDGISGVSVLGLAKMRETSVKNPNHLQLCLNQVFDPEDDKTVDNTYRCYYWLAYGGLPEEEIFSVRAAEVDFETMEVRHAGYTVPIYREALKAFKNCVSLDHFIYQNPGYVNKKDIVRFRADGDILIRGIRAIPTVRSMRTELSRRTKAAYDSGKTKVRLSYYRVWLSGVFYRQWELEELGFPADFLDVAEKFSEGKEYKLDKSRKTQNGKLRDIANSFRRDYEQWKAAYSVL